MTVRVSFSLAQCACVVNVNDEASFYRLRLPLSFVSTAPSVGKTTRIFPALENYGSLSLDREVAGNNLALPFRVIAAYSLFLSLSQSVAVSETGCKDVAVIFTASPFDLRLYHWQTTAGKADNQQAPLSLILLLSLSLSHIITVAFKLTSRLVGNGVAAKSQVWGVGWVEGLLS